MVASFVSLAMLWATVATTQIVPAGDAELDAYVRQRVQAQQASLPMDHQNGFVFTAITYANLEMHYAVDVSGLTGEELQAGVPEILPSSCAAAKPFVERGITYRYTYKMVETGEIETVILNRDVCSRY